MPRRPHHRRRLPRPSHAEGRRGHMTRCTSIRYDGREAARGGERGSSCASFTAVCSLRPRLTIHLLLFLDEVINKGATAGRPAIDMRIGTSTSMGFCSNIPITCPGRRASEDAQRGAGGREDDVVRLVGLAEVGAERLKVGDQNLRHLCRRLSALRLRLGSGDVCPHVQRVLHTKEHDLALLAAFGLGRHRLDPEHGHQARRGAQLRVPLCLVLAFGLQQRTRRHHRLHRGDDDEVLLGLGGGGRAVRAHQVGETQRGHLRLDALALLLDDLLSEEVGVRVLHKEIGEPPPPGRAHGERRRAVVQTHHEHRDARELLTHRRQERRAFRDHRQTLRREDQLRASARTG
mmetsp:Transcript_4051/g.9172  ORF Transcript_4051/g.9172 Transcript_4051/m.9172 type:complete len:347 (-) Transcript_4051:330-1370(-)